jgi:hypothetical protein
MSILACRAGVAAKAGRFQSFAQRTLRLSRLQSQDQQIEEREQQGSKSEPDAGDPKENYSPRMFPRIQCRLQNGKTQNQ